MAQLQPSLLMREAAYLASELTAPMKYEYVAGRVFLMSGTSRVHNLISGNAYSLFRRTLRGKPCKVFIADLKVRVPTGPAYYYPNVVIECDPHDQNKQDRYVIHHPCLIAEVLSPSTEMIDRREKLIAYQSLNSLQGYLILAQNEVKIEWHCRDEQGS